jgi:hypothetical protein
VVLLCDYRLGLSRLGQESSGRGVTRTEPVDKPKRQPYHVRRMIFDAFENEVLD